MVDVNEIINIDGKKLVMITIADINSFYLVYADGKAKEVTNIKQMKKADKDIFIAKLFEIMKGDFKND